MQITTLSTGVILFVLSVLSFHIIFEISCDPQRKNERLLLVNVFNRHGDRSPIAPMPKGDKHALNTAIFWPNGLDNLTPSGELRMFRLGLALRDRYRDFADFDPKSILAVTSNVTRCRQSLESTLRGFYDMTRSIDEGERLARKLKLRQISDIPAGPGTSSAWKEVKLQEELVPSLSYNYIRKSKYATNHRNPVKDDLMKDPHIAKLAGVDKLKRLLNDHYGIPFASKMLTLLSTIQAELYLDRTRETIGHMDHFADWISEPVLESQASSSSASASPASENIEMLELLDEVNLLAFIGMLDDKLDYLATSPVISSLVESQSIALNRPISQPRWSTNRARDEQYQNKKLIIYSTHDTIITPFLYDLGIIDPVDGATFAERLLKAKQSNATDLDKFLMGLKTCHFGISAIFELWQIEMDSGEHVDVVRLALYNEADPKSAPIQWKNLPLGSLCKRRFKQLYPDHDFGKYYLSESELNDEMNCPFDLFKTIAYPWKFNEAKYSKIYNDIP